MQTEQQPSAPETKPDFAIVGIGASAGGLSALKRLFAQLPADSGLAYVIVVHLSPEHESHLPDILQLHVPIPVQQVPEVTPIEPNRIYVIPPGRNLDAVDTHLRLTPLEHHRRDRAPIDHFFRTLASTYDGVSIGVILSGTGSDGTLGLKAIKEHGGLAIVQDPNEAEYDGMPQSAISTGLVDLILPVAEIPPSILRYVRTQPDLPATPEDADEDVGEDTRQLLQRLFTQIRGRTGRDFSRYKRSTILRRIQRRMQLHQIERAEAYLGFVRDHPEEARALSDDFLITVTSFFRDPEVFERLEREVIPSLFEGRDPDDTVRIWVVGCASGEEAYSLAILLLEAAARCSDPPALQVFASDLHERSLALAREGLYPKTIDADVSPERLERFFINQGGGYRVREEVRELVVFAPHNLLADPPFSKLDLISCRNLLIYLEREIQAEVLELFHYALHPDGLLLLGGSETARTDLFRVVDKPACIHRKRNVPSRGPHLPVFTLGARSRRSPAPRALEPAPEQPNSYADLHTRLIARHAAPSLLINHDHQVVHLSSRAGRYLQVPDGEPTMSVFHLVREELRLELRAALHLAELDGRTIRTAPVELDIDGARRELVIEIWPSDEPALDGMRLLTFEDRPALGSGARDSDQAPDPSAPAMDEQFERTKQRLQQVIEKYEASQQDMRAANEELQSGNEELRSTMEELETSKEELQSMNEELATLNQENRHKVEELSQLSSDLQNLMAATDIATLFLDRDLRILRFTPKVGELFNVRNIDRGRPLTDLTHRLGYPELVADAQRVLDRLTPVEREVEDQAGRWYLTRVLPYRSAHDQIGGVVITLVEISERKRTEERLRERAEADGFRLALADATRLLAEPLAVQAAAVELLGRRFGANRVFYAELTNGAAHGEVRTGYRHRVADMVGDYHFEDHGPQLTAELRAGRTVVVEDVASEPRLDPGGRARATELEVAAFVTVPVVKGTELVGVFVVQQAEPRVWKASEIALMEEAVERMWATADRARAAAAVAVADRRKDEFLATLAHELRNPLAPIVTALELLRQPDPDLPVASLHAIIERQVEHMVRLVDDLLDVSRITRGVIELRRQPVALGEIVSSAIETSRPHVEAEQRRLEVDLSEEPLYVDGDPARLVQIVANLLNNAGKYTSSEGRIWLQLERAGGCARISVRDDGIGIPAAMQAQVFDMFAQVDRQRSEGLGVGLNLVRSLVEMHGGTVEVHSEGSGHGSEFVVCLPLLEPDQDPRPPLPEPSEPAALAPRLHRALVVDDNRDAADSLALLLGSVGVEAEVAYDGLTALERLRGWPAQLIVLDLGLPDMDGYALARAIRKLPEGPSLTLVAVTGWGQAEHRRRTHEAGFDHHFVKPVSIAQLSEVLTVPAP
jgi:two-component system, chemotaxis family, CheB/CheR fusion protein